MYASATSTNAGFITSQIICRALQPLPSLILLLTSTRLAYLLAAHSDRFETFSVHDSHSQCI